MTTVNLSASKPSLDRQREEAAARGHRIQEVRAAEGDRPLELTVDLEVGHGQRQVLRYWYVTRREELPRVWAWLEGLTTVGLDLETAGLDPWTDRIATLQLGHPRAEGVQAVVIDVRCFASEDLEPAWRAIESPKVTKLGQNIRFEYRFLRAQYGVRARKLADTQLAEMVLRAGLLQRDNVRRSGEDRAAYKHTSMWALVQRYLGIDIDKDKDLRISFDRTPPGEHTLRQILYAATDVIYPFHIAEQQRTVVEDRGLRGVIKVEMELLPVLGEMEYRGLRMDRNQWRALWQEARQKRAEAEAALDRLLWPATMHLDLFDTPDAKERPIYPKTGRPLNYSSAEQVRWAIQAHCLRIQWPRKVVLSKPEVAKLKQRYGAEWIRNQEAHGRTVTADEVPDRVIPEEEYCVLTEADRDTLILRRVRKQLPADVVNLLLEYSKYDIRCNTFGNDFLVKHVRQDTGRVHQEVHQAITSTGRLSSQPNLQNIPSDPRYRRCFVPGPGYKFVIADYSQQEPRLLAQVSRDPTYLRTYHSGDDLYYAVAEAMLGTRPDAATPEGRLLRQVFKVIVLSIAYRSGANKLRDQLTAKLAEAIEAGLMEPPTLEYAAGLLKAFFEIHGRIKEYQERCSQAADPRSPSAPKIWDDLVGGLVTYVRAPCGRVRFFPPDATNTYTEGANAPIQGGSATMTKAAAGLIQREIDARGWGDLAWIANLVHDEIVSEVHESIAEEYAQIKREMMERAGRFYCPDVPIIAEFPKGSNGVVSYWTKGE